MPTAPPELLEGNVAEQVSAEVRNWAAGNGVPSTVPGSGRSRRRFARFVLGR